MKLLCDLCDEMKDDITVVVMCRVCLDNLTKRRFDRYPDDEVRT